MTNFMLVFAVVLVLNIVVTFRSSAYYKKYFGKASTEPDAPPASGSAVASGGVDGEDDATAALSDEQQWTKIIRKYLIVYLLAALSDWLQGPYVYALYAAYGFTRPDIAILFVAGFGSSMVFGSFVGGIADWGGRRAFVLVFAVIYAASCVTKHFKSFEILMIGRLLGGIATSLLFSVFDAWLIRVHADANIKHMLGRSFSWAAYGNSVIAIVAGLIANKAANAFPMYSLQEGTPVMAGGFINPFDIALLALILCGGCAAALWEENYGDTAEGAAASSKESSNKWHEGLKGAFITTIRSVDISLCGAISSLFEGSMYIWVFMWTPALESVREGEEQLPFGLIFSTFMVCCMAGSSLFSILAEHYRGEQLAIGVFAVGTISMAAMVLSSTLLPKLLAMNLFEIAVGMYWPIMGTMKGNIVPESKRAAIYNVYRIPLNFIVLFSLLTNLTPTQSFTLNAFMLGTATFLQMQLKKRREKNNRVPASDTKIMTTETTDDSTTKLLSSNETTSV